MFNTVNQGQSVTNNYAGSDWFVHQVFLTGRCNKKHQSNGHYSPIFITFSKTAKIDGIRMPSLLHDAKFLT
jgi:hypothetical protein